MNVHVTHQNGVPVTQETIFVGLTPLRLPDGNVLLHQTPLSAAFYLVTANELRNRGERERQVALRRAGPETSDFGDLHVPDRHAGKLMDGLWRLCSAVVLSAAAVEAYANEAIDRLDESATIIVERREGKLEIAMSDMERRLRLEEKLDLAVPLATGRPSIKGRSEIWTRFRRLSDLRNEVVHLKERGRTNDPDMPGIFGRLVLGEGATCIEDAAAVIDACEPTWLPDATRRELSLAG
jgi:hypothetical protein